MKLFSVIVGGGAVLLLLASSALALPTSVSDFMMRNLKSDFEVVDGPKEFLVPVAPLQRILGERLLSSEGSEGGGKEGVGKDLDYMVYGKFYLMKMLGVGDKLESARSEENLVNSNSPDTSEVSLTPNLFGSGRRTPTRRYTDAIAFPPQQMQVQGAPTKEKRRYRYQLGNKRSIGGTATKNQFYSTPSPIRNIEERSASSDKVISTTQPTTTFIDTTSTEPEPQQTSIITLDEEELELVKNFQKTVTNSRQSGFGFPSNDDDDDAKNSNDDDERVEKKSGNEPVSSLANIGADGIVLGDRFLLDVPPKPTSNQTAQCPSGQRRIHRGACKPVYTHNPSPQDGIYAGKLSTTTNYARNKPELMSASNNARSGGCSDLKLATLFRSYLEFEKRLTKTLQEAERLVLTSDDDQGGKKTPDVEGKVETSPT